MQYVIRINKFYLLEFFNTDSTVLCMASSDVHFSGVAQATFSGAKRARESSVNDMYGEQMPESRL